MSKVFGMTAVLYVHAETPEEAKAYVDRLLLNLWADRDNVEDFNEVDPASIFEAQP